MFQRKFAVLVGCTEFPKTGALLPPLPSAMTDVRELEGLLEDKAVGGFTDVQVVLDLPHWEVMMRLNQALRDANRDDQVLLYYSGHGLLDSDGNLFLATSNTEPSLLRSTTGATGSLTIARTARHYANPDVIVRIRAAIVRRNVESGTHPR